VDQIHEDGVNGADKRLAGSRVIWTAVGGPPLPGGDWPVETDRERRVKVQNVKDKRAPDGITRPSAVSFGFAEAF